MTLRIRKDQNSIIQQKYYKISIINYKQNEI